MDLLVVVIVLVAIALPTALVARRDARLGIVAHPGDIELEASTADETGEDLVEGALRTRRESEWRYWYQLGNS
ncbi:MAG TPA: hypothetical protein VD767_09235 [Thermomicrobiales bacterium]|nr:hypothetical protein [Thermomicrobiales bacterium]